MPDKEQLLKEIKESILKNKSLPLRETATNLVFGKGNPQASIVLIGEAPGHNEDLQGLPFVGIAGKTLDKMIEKIGLTLNDIYITNILKYRPPENRNPLPQEIMAHTPYLKEQIAVISPKVICSLGNYATKFLLADGDVEKMDKQEGITKLHGKPINLNFQGKEIKLIPLFHPAAIIYNRKLQEEWEKDILIVKEEIKK